MGSTTGRTTARAERPAPPRGPRRMTGRRLQLVHCRRWEVARLNCRHEGTPPGQDPRGTHFRPSIPKPDLRRWVARCAFSEGEAGRAVHHPAHRCRGAVAHDVESARVDPERNASASLVATSRVGLVPTRGFSWGDGAPRARCRPRPSPSRAAAGGGPGLVLAPPCPSSSRAEIPSSPASAAASPYAGRLAR
jgi:hypothetical protein